MLKKRQMSGENREQGTAENDEICLIGGGGGDTAGCAQHAKLAASGYHCGDENPQSPVLSPAQVIATALSVTVCLRNISGIRPLRTPPTGFRRVGYFLSWNNMRWTAEYLVVMDQRKLDAGQHSELVNQYHAVN